jgi:CspA family cold shock protein
MQTGKIVTLTDKGFGFIRPEGSEVDENGRSKDLFFHSNNLVNVHFDDLQQGDTLQFTIEEGDKGPNAVEVSKV